MMAADALLARKLLVVSGKGGVGKSFLAACLAAFAARQGKKVLLVESAAQEQLAPLFGHKPVGHQETYFLENLYGINLQANECFREYVVDHLGMASLYEHVLNHRLVKSFLDAIPGLSEIMLLGRLYHSCMLKKPPFAYDLVVFDGPASGHCLNLLTSPDAAISSGLVGPMIKEVQRVRDFLAAPGLCGLLLAAVPEELVVSESLEFLPRLLSSSPIPLVGMVMNKAVMPWYAQAWQELESLLANDEIAQEVGAYLIGKAKRALQEQESLELGLQALGLADYYLRLADLGIVSEPMGEEAMSRLWEEAFRYEH